LPLIGLIIQTPTPKTLSLNELIEEAKLNNPEIRAAKARHEATAKKMSVFRYLMDPLLGFEFGNDMQIYSISQEFPFPTKLASLSKLAESDAQQAFEEYRKKEQEIIAKVKKIYAQLCLIEKQIELTIKSKNILNQILSIAMRNYSLNKNPQSDVLRTAIETAKIDNKLIGMKDEETIMRSKLNSILDRPVDSNISIITDIEIKKMPSDLETLYAIVKENQPILKSFRSALKSADISLSLSKQEYLPDFMVKFEQQVMGSQLQDRKFMFGFTIPVWFWAKQKNMVNEMKAEKKMIEADYKAMENMFLVEAKEAKIMVDKHKREMDLFENSILPQVEATLKSSLRAYEVNQVDFMTLLDNEKMLVESELEYYQAQVNLFIAISELETTVGTELKNE